MVPIRLLIFLSLATVLQAQVSIIIASNPAGATFTVNGTGCATGAYTAPQTLTWTPGSNCTISFTSPQSKQTGVQTVFSAWQDGPSQNPRTIIAPAQTTTYIANFTTQYLLTTVAVPPAGGTVTGGGFYNANSTATLTATPAPGYRLLQFVSSNFTVTGPATLTAYFSNLPPPPVNYSVTQIAAGMFAALGKSINNYGQVIGFSASSPPRALLWTPSSANASAGNLMDLGSLPSNAPPTMFPTGINGYGQVVGNEQDNAGGSQSFLWQPTTANSTSGTLMTFLGTASANASAAYGINTLGQIVGSTNRSYFLWTPSSPNGTAGTAATDNFGGAFAINDDGQLLLATGGVASTFTGGTTLFTPSTPNGITGTYTALPGMNLCNGDPQTSQINPYGMITGWRCSAGLLTIANQGAFLWTPSAANTPTGSLASIPSPPGYPSVEPQSLNSSGAVVGSIGALIPFLYQNSTLYDLSTLNSTLIGGSAAGINDRGQIVVNANNGVYLLTPIIPSTPAAPNPQSGAASAQTITYTFNDPRGWQDLDVVNVLINNFIDGRNACYLAYSVGSKTLSLVNDAGTAGPSAGTVTLGDATPIQNSQCSVSLTSATGTGNTLTLTLAFLFKPQFADNKIQYLAARDLSQNNSGWMPLGVWQVPGNAPLTTTAVISANPSTGAFRFSDTQGTSDLGVLNILVNSALDGGHACYLAISQGGGKIQLVSDDGNSLIPSPPFLLTTGGTVYNSQCTVTWGNNAVTTAGNVLTLNLNITFSPAFGPDLIFYLAARDRNESNNTGWQASATWMAH